MTKGAKHLDSGKPPLDVLSQLLLGLEEVAKAVEFGEKKYGPGNWQKGMEWRKLLGSTLRHVFKWGMGRDLDEESGLNHLAHAVTDLLFLLHYQIASVGTDDRVK
jgi:hypothetical protein